MKKIIPYPFLALALFGMWILLTGFSPGHILLGSAIAIFVSRTMLSLRPSKPSIKLSPAIWRLALLIWVDIIRSNFETAKVILMGKKDREAGFVNLPITVRSPYALATLSIMCTATPGTLWVQYDPSRHLLLMHFLNIHHADGWCENYRSVVEPLLMEIFE